MRSQLTKLLSLLFALAMITAACGSDGDTTDAGDDTDTTAETDAGEDTTDSSADEETEDGDTTSDEEGTDDADSDDTQEGTDDGEEAAGGDLSCDVADLPLYADGKLTIATGDPVFPPWMIDDDPTNGEGFESAVVYALAEEMGFAPEDVEWVRTDFDVAIAPGDKEYDFNMQQYSPLPERDEIVDFSQMYYKADKAVLALSDSPAVGAATFADLQDATWGATIGTTDLAYIEDEMGIEDVAVYDTQADTIAAMVAGQIDATVISLPGTLFLSAVELEDGVVAGVLPDSEGEGSDGMALLFAEGSELVPCVDQALATLEAAGTLDELAETWLQGEGEIPNISR